MIFAIFKYIFLKWKFCILQQISFMAKTRPRPNSQSDNIGSGNGLALSRCQAIT